MLSLEPMPDKSHATPDGLCALSNHRLITLSGRDAVAFAQAQFMNDVTLLADGQWQWNGWLTPKGRVVALFALLRVDAETLWLVVPDADPRPLADALKRFVFRSKVAIALREDLYVAGRLDAPVVASAAMAAVTTDATGGAVGAELDMSGEGGPRTLSISASPRTPSPTFDAAWAAADLRHGLPRLPASQAEHWTPQQLSLERLKAFSVKKGCYPGQEIVARTHFLGKVKRGLMLVESTASLDAGAELLAAGSALGTVVASARDEAGSIGLAVVPLERDASAALTLGAAPVTEAALLGGLAR
ncbi:folate-binding protein YgfZ [Lysobacter olei]